jgi:hypothetical protein
MNTKSTMEHSAEVSESEISVVAYQKWEKVGHPSDRNLQFWLDAEAQLRAAAKAAGAIPTAHLPPVASENSAHKAGHEQLGPSQPNSPKPGQKSRRR